MLDPSKGINTFYLEQVSSYTGDACAHCIEHET